MADGHIRTLYWWYKKCQNLNICVCKNQIMFGYLQIDPEYYSDHYAGVKAL